jgi:glutamate-1-semialdehyde 2,1-aminomutase
VSSIPLINGPSTTAKENIYQRSYELYKDACKYIPGGVNSSLRNIEPHLTFKRAEGPLIIDADDNEYIDYQSAFGPPILGHSHPKVTRKVKDILEKLDLIGIGTEELEIQLAKKLVQHVPSAEKVLLCNSGSEATYMALRLARAVTGRKRIIKFQGCYHGWHDAVCLNILSAADKIGKKDLASAGMVDEVADYTSICTFNDLDHIEQTFNKYKGEIAAIILEPIPHNIGCVLPKKGFLEGLREITKNEKAVLIFDEVITGFRHSLGGYQKIAGVIPDLTTLGKAMANGYPMAAICGRAELMDRFATNKGDVFFAGTYNGHPVGCAAALGTIEVLEQEGTYEYLFGLGDRVRNGLRDIVNRLGIKATVAGFGSVFLTYFMDGPIENYSDLMRNDADKFVSYRLKLLQKGIFKLPLNLKRNHISSSHTNFHIDKTLEACEDVLQILK